jgi:Rps23 Pro-64 3,4-dihydroxylase Tpa1-like proline 4-hydroxylase
LKTSKIIQQEDIQDILELTKISNIFEAPTTSSNSNKWRNSLKYQVNYQLFPELCKTIEDFVNDGTKVNQFDLLLYKEGHYYKKHKDIIEEVKRTWTSITMIDKKNLQGGEIVIYDGDEHVIDLDIGETVVFKSSLTHKAKEVLQGTRLVLVAWLN